MMKTQSEKAWIAVRIPNEIVIPSVTIPNAVICSVLLQRRVTRRYPTDCLHTNRQLKALGVLFAEREVRFWNEVLS